MADPFTRLRRLVDRYYYDPSYLTEHDAIGAPMPGLQKFQEQCDQSTAYQWPVLKRDQERHLFVRLNYRKHQIACLLPGEGFRAPNANVVRSTLLQCAPYEYMIERDIETISKCNMRMLWLYANKYPPEVRDEMFSLGQETLMRSIHRYNPFQLNAKGTTNKFGTYLCWAIRKNFAGSARLEFLRQDRYKTMELTGVIDDRDHEDEQEQAELRKQVADLLAQLTDRERLIIIERFGLKAESKSLREVSEGLGITKERVRQLQLQAIALMRKRAEEG